MSLVQTASKGGAGDACAFQALRIGAPLMTAASSEHLPLVDPSVLRELEIQLDDRAAARSFAQDFVRIWERRFERVTRTIAGHDPAAWDAVLSIKTASIMVGAARLAHMAGELENMIRSGPGVPPGAVEAMALCGRETVRELQSYSARSGASR